MSEINEINKLPQGAGENDPLKSKENFQRRPHRSLSGKVYFVRAGDAIKIGYSKEPKSRIRRLQTSSAVDLDVLGIIDGTMDDEKSLHCQFEYLHLRGEWFQTSPELLAHIATLTGKAAPIRPHRRSVFTPEAAAMISRLSILRTSHGANTPMGHTCSNLIAQIKELRNYVRPAWAQHPRQSLQASIEHQMKRLERFSAATQ